MRGIRHLVRDFTASAVKEHLRSQIEDTRGQPALTKNEIELVLFIQTSSLEVPSNHSSGVSMTGP